jgi:hypothetical protein
LLLLSGRSELSSPLGKLPAKRGRANVAFDSLDVRWVREGGIKKRRQDEIDTFDDLF